MRKEGRMGKERKAELWRTSSTRPTRRAAILGLHVPAVPSALSHRQYYLSLDSAPPVFQRRVHCLPAFFACSIKPDQHLLPLTSLCCIEHVIFPGRTSRRYLRAPERPETGGPALETSHVAWSTLMHMYVSNVCIDVFLHRSPQISTTTWRDRIQLLTMLCVPCNLTVFAD